MRYISWAGCYDVAHRVIFICTWKKKPPMMRNILSLSEYIMNFKDSNLANQSTNCYINHTQSKKKIQINIIQMYIILRTQKEDIFIDTLLLSSCDRKERQYAIFSNKKLQSRQTRLVLNLITIDNRYKNR